MPFQFYIFVGNMSKIKQIYKNNKDGIIFTLIFHILVFIVLNITQFRIKQEFIETELIIDFPFEPIQQEEIKKEQLNNQTTTNINRQTNIASNRAAEKRNDVMDEKLQRELEQARELVERVSQQLSKDIPTIKDLKMPEETTEGMDPDSLMNKLYTGNSNVEYYLENRFHTRLPIPIYLSQYGGVVTVNIIVDRSGTVVSANPVVSGNLNDQLLSYAKTAALRTRFNPSNSSETRQPGYIRYTFIPQ